MPLSDKILVSKIIATNEFTSFIDAARKYCDFIESYEAETPRQFILLSQNHLLLVGYHTWCRERQVAYEAKLEKLGYVIGPAQMERVGDFLGRGNSRETLSDVYGE